MSKTLLIDYISIFSIIPAVICSLVYWKSYQLSNVRWIAIWTLYKLVFESIAYLSSSSNNLPFYYLYTSGEIVLIAAWMRSLPYMHKWRKALLWVALALCLLLMAESSLHWGEFIRYTKSAESVTFSLLCGLVFYRWYQTPHFQLLIKSADFYANLSFFVYFCLNSAVFVYLNQLSVSASGILWIAHSVCNTASNIFLFLSVYVSRRKRAYREL